MLGRLIIAVVALFVPVTALAQGKPALNRAAQAIVGTWEFSNADRDRTCTLVLKSDGAAVGYKLEFDATCAAQFPLVRDIVGWRYPDDDLLYLLDAQGRALIEFSEVEDGLFEAPTRGVGVLFLQNPAAIGPPPKTVQDVAGDWTLRRGADSPLCTITLTTTAAKDAYVLAIKPGCDPAIVQLKLNQWRMDRGELLLVAANAEPWRFEEIDGGAWRRLPEGPDPITLVRQ
jgi:hypothetical protein